MSQPPTFDKVWEEKYSAGHQERYPWDCIVTFVFRNRPREKAITDTHVLEVGCGTGNNLWFAAREGFQVTGVDGSASAIQRAQERFASESLSGTFKVGDFTVLPLENEHFDLAIDRGSLSCCDFEDGARAINEIHRVLKPGGRFFFSPYSARMATRGLIAELSEGSLEGAGQICFYSREDIVNVLRDKWTILSIQHHEIMDETEKPRNWNSFWNVVAEKKVV
ncbi:MAG TPA: class I SAM-dependent methyltransferase [Candidatus Methylacidiphilales bacterium]|nr:class I SAM-dependent methyltransferase [Candidatus Methylacidiphilales bacterium]